MTRDQEWAVFEKAIDLTASAVRGALGGEGSQSPSFVADVFREAHAALREAAEQLPDKAGKTGF